MKRTGLGALAAAAAALLATGALAEEPRDEQAAKKEKKVCKTEKMTGSLTRVRRICLTQSDWAEIAENTSRTINRVERSANHAEALTSRDQQPGRTPGGGHTF